MKKIIFILVAVLATTFTSYAQLQTKTIEESSGYKNVHKFWMGYGVIRYCDGAYILFGASTNQFENTMHSIYLGDDKDSAIQSLRDLGNLKKECKGTIVVSGGFNKTTKISRLAGFLYFETSGVAGGSNALAYLNVEKAITAIQNFR